MYTITFLAALLIASVATFSPRHDYRSSFQPSMKTGWGSWGFVHWCPANTWATAFSLRVERSQGGNSDDTALNGIKLTCTSASHGRALGGTEIHSALSGWGGWTTKLYCPAEYFLVGGRGRSEAHEDDQDDTAANDYDFECRKPSGSDLYDLYGDGMSWGSWSGWRRCPSGQAICGIKTKVEGSQGRGDDTALNDAVFYCCAIN